MLCGGAKSFAYVQKREKASGKGRASLVDEGQGVFEGVAPVAEARCVILLYFPGVGRVAVQARKGGLVEVESVLAHPGLAAMAPAQAVTAFYLQFLVGVVAFVALKIRHHP